MLSKGFELLSFKVSEVQRLRGFERTKPDGF